jgi:hypothetical protein
MGIGSCQNGLSTRHRRQRDTSFADRLTCDGVQHGPFETALIGGGLSRSQENYRQYSGGDANPTLHI